MTLTGAQLLTGFSTFLDDYEAHTTTSSGASDGTTIVDTSLEKYGDGRLVGRFVRITNAGGTQYEVSRITANLQATGTVTVAPPFSAQIAGSKTYDLHQYEPSKKFAALDSARIPIADDVFRLITDETITTDGYSSEYTIPTLIHRGPALVYLERRGFSPIADWNFIPNPYADDIMASWTASNATKADYPSVEQDKLIPKYGTGATKVSVAASVTGTLTLAVADMANSITAAKAAGRYMTFAAWVYSRSASNLTIVILDDSGTLATSSAHQGLGWELLHVSATVTQTNATTLSLRFAETSASASTFFVNSMWFYYGDYTQINSQFYNTIPLRIRRDNTTQRFVLPEVPEARRQLRLVGKEILTALGTTVSTQNSNTMEVDETTAEILYATAANILFEQERISTQNLQQVLQRIAAVKDRLPAIRMNWQMEITPQRFSSPYSR